LTDAVRSFLIKTLLEDRDATKGLDNLLAKATRLTEKAYTMTVSVATTQAEKALATVEKAAKAAANIDSSKATKGQKEQAQATATLTDRLKLFSEHSKKAGEATNGFFSKLDAGRLVMAGAAGGLALYAKSVIEVYEAHKLAKDMITDQLGGAASSGLMGFINKGGETSGTSARGRLGVSEYLAMTGEKDAGRIEDISTNAEKVMKSTWGKSLKKYGIADEKGLVQTISKPIAEDSDIGLMLRQKMPQLFTTGARESMETLVAQEGKFKTKPMIQAEAGRRLTQSALKQATEGYGQEGGLMPDADSYRQATEDMSEATDKLQTSIGKALEPAITALVKFATIVTKVATAAPELTILAATIITVGGALAVLGMAIPYVVSGITAMKVGMTALKTTMLANPIFLVVAALVALAVMMVALESKTQIFSKAWDRFTKSEIGSDIIGGVKQLLGYFGLLGEGDWWGPIIKGAEMVAGFIGGVFDQVNNVYKLLKGGDLIGALKGGVGLMVKLSPIGMAVGFAEALLPGKRVQDMILYVLQKMKDLWDGFIRWLTDIYKAVAGPLSGIWDIAKKILEGLPGWLTKGKEGTPAENAEEDKKIGNSVIKDAPPESASDKEKSDYAMKKAREYYPDTEKYSDKDLKGLANDIYDAVQARGSVNEQEKVDRLNAQTPQVPTTPEAGTSISAAQQNTNDRYNEALLKTGSQTAAVSSSYRPLTMLYDYLTGGSSKPTQGDSSTSPTPPPAETPYVEGMDLSDPTAIYINKNTNVERTAAEIGSYPAEDQAKFFKKNALGGEVTKSGLGWIDEGEPIVPAEVSRSSVLIDRLRAIASGEGGASAGAGAGTPLQIINNITVEAGPGTDGYAIGRQIAEELDKRLDDFSFKSKVESIINRGGRAFIS
jgi:hypothetical protein